METAAKQGPSWLKSKVLNWLGFGYTDIDNWRALYGGKSESGECVTPETAMKFSAVYACTRLISQTISTLPINYFERSADDTRTLRNELPLARILRQKPNADMTAVVFWEATVASILLQRGAFLEKKMLGGRLVAVDFIHPVRISRPKYDSDFWNIIDLDGTLRQVDKSLIVYVPAFSTDGRCGMSVIEYGLEVIGSGLSASKAANKTFKQGLAPTVGFEYPQVLQPNQREEMRATIETLSGAANAGRPVILEAGMKAVPIGIDPKDAQLLESRVRSAEEVCSLFGVPPPMIGLGDKASSWASSSEAMNSWFLQYALRPWIRRIESAIWDGILNPKEQASFYAEFSVEGLLRADTQGRASLYSQGLQNGWMSRNEVRRLENLPPIEGGDIYTAQTNLVPLDQLGQPDPIDRMLADEIGED